MKYSRDTTIGTNLSAPSKEHDCCSRFRDFDIIPFSIDIDLQPGMSWEY
jgi:hypothetical protein